MLAKNSGKSTQVQMVSIDQLVPEDHLLRRVDATIDFSFIYDLVKDKYCSDNGFSWLIAFHNPFQPFADKPICVLN